MPVKLFTWNLQGAGDKSGQSKAVTFKKLLANADILCLQECGDLGLQKDINWKISPDDGKTVAVGEADGFAVYYYYWSERCNLALFFKGQKMMERYQFFLPDKETQRPVLGAQYNDVWIFSVHGPGKACNWEYCKSVLGYINTFVSSGSKQWIAAGDFNCDRDYLANKMWDFDIAFASSCGHSTHVTAGKEIDLVAYSPSINVSKGECLKAKDGCEFSSDHTPMSFVVG